MPVLLEAGHYVICCVRDLDRFNPLMLAENRIQTIEVDFLKKESLDAIPQNIDCAYYLIHSLSNEKNREAAEQQSAQNFRLALDSRHVRQVVFLSRIVNRQNQSKYLASRVIVENELEKGKYNLTVLRAGIIIGSGSASFEIIRDLVEKFPVVIGSKWFNTKCQPISIADVITCLFNSLINPKVYGKNFDIGGADVLTYKEMLLEFGKVRNLQRKVYVIPILTHRNAAFRLYYATSTSYKLAEAMISSMKGELLCRDNQFETILEIKPLGYREALERTFSRIEKNEIMSSWKDSYESSGMNIHVSDFVRVPSDECYVDRRERIFDNREQCLNRIWTIGGQRGWYYGNWLWKLRGFMDKLVGGVGLKRGRTHPDFLNVGDSLDVWRVLYANKTEGRLLLFAEMKLPGEAWLEFKTENETIVQTATFKPFGILGQIYWYLVYPFHGFIFNGMIDRLSGNRQDDL